MTLLIGKPKKPVTSLKEKQDGFKFQMPSPKVDSKRETTNKTATTSSSKRVGNTVDNTPNSTHANNLLIGKSKTRSVDKSKSPLINAKPTTPIPEMSDDKYEVVANSVPEFSEAAGNKFEEQITMLQQAVDGTGELKDQMVNILTFLDDNPQYKANVSPKDVAVFVAACRKVAGITVQEKTTRKTSTKKVSAKVEEVFSDLADLNFEL